MSDLTGCAMTFCVPEITIYLNRQDILYGVIPAQAGHVVR